MTILVAPALAFEQSENCNRLQTTAKITKSKFQSSVA